MAFFHASSVRSLAFAATASSLLGVSSATADVYDIRIIAATDDGAPGTINGDFTHFGLPRINEVSQVSFVGFTSSGLGSSGMWTTTPNDPQTLDFVVGTGWPVPGAPGLQFEDFDSSFYHPMIASDGDIGFSAPVNNGGEFGAGLGLFRQVDGVVELVALPGDQAPGLSNGITFKGFGNLIGYNRNGLMVFDAELQGPGVTEDNDDAVFMHWFGGLTLVAREGSPAFGMPGTTWTPYGFGAPHVDDTGRIAFVARLEGNVDADWSLWTGYPGAFERRLTDGDLSPYNGGEAFMSLFNGYGFTLGTDGDLMVPAYTDMGGDDARFTLTKLHDGVIQPLAGDGLSGPLGSHEYLNRQVDRITESGMVVFTGRAQNLPDDADSAIYRQFTGQAAEVLVQEGDQPYGWGANAAFNDLSYTYHVVADDDDRVYFAATTTGPGITEDNDYGAWSVDADGTMHRVIREGEFLLVNGVWKQVDTFDFGTGFGNHTGRRPAVNRRGHMALRIRFTDGTSAVALAMLPPSCPADRNDDGVVDFADILIVLAQWDQTSPIGLGGDADFDGDTDFDDLLLVLTAFGMEC